MTLNNTSKIWEDKWIHTACGGCYNGCAIKVRRVNGVAVAIEGVTDSPHGGRGGMCGKGTAALMNLYDPNRLNHPLRRTNPEKGLGVDPKWEKISWEEALSEITAKLIKVKNDNPQKLWMNGTTSHSFSGWGSLGRNWINFLGSTQRLSSGGSLHCGNGAHHNAGLVHGSWSSTVDWKYADYVLKWGSGKGTGSGHSMTVNARLRAEAIARGATEVCFDPICNFAGGKASRWIPLLPGTDTAVALAICNVIMNDLQVYDEPFLKKKTNLPFLVSPEGTFLLDKMTAKALVWDKKEGKAKVFDDPDIAIDDYALEGEYAVNGVTGKPAFVLLKEHLKTFTPAWAAKISTVPAATITQIAGEFAEHARIGSTIKIDGQSFPLRPVGTMSFRGVTGHSNGTHQCWAVDLLSIIVGAEDVPGGSVGWPCIRLGYPETGSADMIPTVGAEGVIVPALFRGGNHAPWPIKLPSTPCLGGRCEEFWPMATASGIPHMIERDEIWAKLGLTAKPEMMINLGGNLIVSVANCDDHLKLFKDIPFIVCVDLYANETVEALADIVLPDQCSLERLDWLSNLESFHFNHPPTLEEWTFHPQFPVIDKTVAERRNWLDVIVELSDRVGFRKEFNSFFNKTFKITDPAYQIKPEEQLSWPEIGDRVLQWCFGPQHGLEFFREHGYIKWPKKPEEIYWRWNWPSLEDIRIPVYRARYLEVGQKAREIGKEIGMDLDYDQYKALPDYFPPAWQLDFNEEYDLVAFSYRDIMHTNSQTAENPWIDEISQLSPYTYTITINSDTAKQKGFKDGDEIWLETAYGKKEKGRLKLMQGQHPLTISIAGQAGLWAKGRPIAKGKGSNFCRLIQSDLKHYDPMTLNMETAMAVKVYRA